MDLSPQVWAPALLALGAAAALAPAVAAAPAPKGNAVAGKTVFARCATCHDVKPGPPKIGPTLATMFGRKAGAVPGFKYSPAMKASKIVWSAPALDAFLTNPARTVPGNRMPFPGMTNATERANLIAYLQSATK